MTGGLTEQPQIPWQILQSAGVDHQYRNPQRLDLLHHQLLVTTPDQHQIRPQSQQALQIDALVIGNMGQLFDRDGPVAGIVGGNDLGACARRG
jgi:hypothetical protein